MSIHLLPEIEASLRAEADARGLSVDALVSEVLAHYVRQNTAQGSVKRIAFNPRTAEVAWAANPDPQYFGKWVVLEGSEVIASGSDAKAIYEEVRGRGVASPFLIYVSPEAPVPFVGGWLD